MEPHSIANRFSRLSVTSAGIIPGISEDGRVGTGVFVGAGVFVGPVGVLVTALIVAEAEGVGLAVGLSLVGVGDMVWGAGGIVSVGVVSLGGVASHKIKTQQITETQQIIMDIARAKIFQGLFMSAFPRW